MPEAVSDIGVRLTLDASSFTEGMGAAGQQLNAFQKEAEQVKQGLALTGRGGSVGGKNTPANGQGQSLNGVNVSLSVSSSEIANLRKKIIEGLGTIPITVSASVSSKVVRSEAERVVAAQITPAVGTRSGAAHAVRTAVKQNLPERRFGGPVQQHRAFVAGEGGRAEIVELTNSHGVVHPDASRYYREQEHLRRVEMEMAATEAIRQRQHERRMRGGGVRGYGGKYGAAKPGTTKSWMDLQDQTWGYRRGEPGRLYHGTDHMPEIRMGSPWTGPGVQPIGGMSFWSRVPVGYGPRLLRTRETPQFHGGSEIFQTNYEAVPRRALQYWGDDNAWHKFRKGRARAQGGVAKRGGLPRGYKMEFWGRTGEPGKNTYGNFDVSPWNYEPEGGMGFGQLPTHISNFRRLSKPVRPPRGAGENWFGSFTTVIRDRAGNIVATAPFETADLSKREGNQRFITPTATWVSAQHRGKGLANAMYVRAEKWSGARVQPDWSQTEAGEALWSQPNRPFGKGVPRHRGMSLGDILRSYHPAASNILELNTGPGAQWVSSPLHAMAGRTVYSSDPDAAPREWNFLVRQAGSRGEWQPVSFYGSQADIAPNLLRYRDMGMEVQPGKIREGSTGPSDLHSSATAFITRPKRAGGGPIHAWHGATALAYRETLANRGGTFPVSNTPVPSSGHAVGISKILTGAEKATEYVDPNDPVAFMRAFHKMRRAGAPYVGTWWPEGEEINVDPVAVIAQRRFADMVARFGEERAGFNLRTMTEWETSKKALRATAERVRKIALGRQGGGPVESPLLRRIRAATEAREVVQPKEPAWLRWIKENKAAKDLTGRMAGGPVETFASKISLNEAREGGLGFFEIVANRGKPSVAFSNEAGKKISAEKYFRIDPSRRMVPSLEGMAYRRQMASYESMEPGEIESSLPWYPLVGATHQSFEQMSGVPRLLTVGAAATGSPRTRFPGEHIMSGRLAQILGPSLRSMDVTPEQIEAAAAAARIGTGAIAKNSVYSAEVIAGKRILKGRKITDYRGSILDADFLGQHGRLHGRPVPDWYTNDIWQNRLLQGDFVPREDPAHWWAARTGGLRAAQEIEAGTGLATFDLQAAAWNQIRNRWYAGTLDLPGVTRPEGRHFGLRRASEAQTAKMFAKAMSDLGRPDILTHWGFDPATGRKRAEGGPVLGMLAEMEPIMGYQMAQEALQRKKEKEQHRAGGGPVYIVGEIGDELYVPDRLAHLIPKKVMDQIPKAASGMQVIGKKRNELFAPPEDGIIVPHRLMDQVPRAQEGVNFSDWPDNDLLETGEQRRARLARERRSEAARRGAETRRRRLAMEAAAVPPQHDPLGAAGLAARNIPAEVAGIAEEETLTPIQRSVQRAVRRSRSLPIDRVNEADELAVMRASAGKSMPSRTGAGAFAAVVSFAFGGVKQLSQAEVERGQALRKQHHLWTQATRAEMDLNAATEELSGKKVTEAQREKVLAPLRAKANEARTAEKASMEELVVATKKAIPTTAQIGKNLASVVLATNAYGIAMQAFSAVLSPIAEGAGLAAERFLDYATGFTASNQRVTKGLGDSLNQMGGNIEATFGQAGMKARMSAEYASFLQGALGGSVTAKAAAGNQAQTTEYLKASLGQGAPTGLLGGYGGFLGTSLFAEQMGGGKGFAEQVVENLGTANNAASPIAGMGPVGPYGTIGPIKRSEQDMAKAVSARDAYVKEVQSEFERGAKALGETGQLFKMVEKKSIEGQQDALAGFGKLGDYAGALSDQGYVLTDMAGNVITTATEYQKAWQQAAKGATMVDPATWAKTMQQSMQAGFTAAAMQRQYATTIAIPAQLGTQLAANPLMAASAGVFAPGGEDMGYGKSTGRIKGLVNDAQKAQDALTAEGDAAIKAQADWIDKQAEGNASLKGAGKEYTAFMDLVKASGIKIRDAQKEVVDAQTAASLLAYNNSHRLATRAVADARGLAGRSGGSDLGALQRSQQMLAFQLQQRQITTQLALAQFQAPGQTGEERYFMQKQKIAEAGIAQQQLTTAKGIFKIEVDRGVIDAQMNKLILETNRALEGISAATAKTIAAEQLTQSQNLAKAGQIVTEAEGTFGKQLEAATSFVGEFGGTIEEATAALRKALGLAPLGGSTGYQDQRSGERGGGGNYPAYTPQRIQQLAGRLSAGIPGLDPKVAEAWIRAEKGVNGNVLGRTYYDAQGNQRLYQYESQEAGIDAAISLVLNSPTYAKLRASLATGNQQQDLAALMASPWNRPYYTSTLPGLMNASGALGMTSGPTRMVVGEAGTEAVAILRNPRMSTISGEGSSGPVSVNININGPVVRNDNDIADLARQVAAEVERSLSRKGQMFGLRGPAV